MEQDALQDIPVRKGDRVAGKVAMVTGAGSVAEGFGNGRAAAFALARHGAKVALLDVNRASAEETARIIRDDGGECLVIQADVMDPASCAAAVQATVAEWGRLDILVNNVGTARVPGDATTVDLEAWERGMRLNVTSMVLMARYAVPEMKKSGGGSIINISSITGMIGGHTNLFYPTSKGALLNMTRTMAGNHGPDGIRVNCICPGFLFTPVVTAGGWLPEGFREARRNAGAIKTEGTGWDVAFGILFLASDEARWITGVILPIDAGVTAITPHFRTSSPSSQLRAQASDWEAAARGDFVPTSSG
ncbi:SDR family NAD(P)-dependent oxidoreductase [Muricoccus pecuniae]|uniref:NAD(P)-dependent dehydrogenase (Short-subunit alcohol dehydrogenase family) n=1 Tax=Muricoccus pecuniae TaxID=693023 RepID=A0A840Y8I0_9PROT|nr:SDR family oxidoreductase [Roseomonas pecuniae]MBB5696240.1 NAD(P)-dependent dehydrogenase (short-subunit alcohol dehydrogenase family) [Roseomonas pecuniae]